MGLENMNVSQILILIKRHVNNPDVTPYTLLIYDLNYCFKLTMNLWECKNA